MLMSKLHSKLHLRWSKSSLKSLVKELMILKLSAESASSTPHKFQGKVLGGGDLNNIGPKISGLDYS